MIIQTIHMKSVTAEGQGTLSVFEGSRDVPFDIKRIYYIHGAPQGTQRGGHAHKALRQVLWCPYGSILIRLDDGHEKSEVLLNDPAKGLIVEHNMWREMLRIISGIMMSLSGGWKKNDAASLFTAAGCPPHAGMDA